MATRSLARVAAVVCLLIVHVSWQPNGAVARTIMPRTCEVCHKHSSEYQPYIRMLKFGNNTVCITNTFLKSEVGDKICDSTGVMPFPEELGAANSETSGVPSCTICHEDAASVSSMQKVWSLENGSQCARAAFVENN